MSKIKLSGGFTVIPEGVHVFKIIAVEYKETFGKLEIKMQTADGLTHIERFSFLRDGGTPNEGAVKAFSYFARVALQDMSADEIDPEDLIGHYIECEVTHDVQPNKNKPGETVTFIRLGDKKAASGFAGAETPKAEPKPAITKPQAPLNLDDILG